MCDQYNNMYSFLVILMEAVNLIFVMVYIIGPREVLHEEGTIHIFFTKQIMN